MPYMPQAQFYQGPRHQVIDQTRQTPYGNESYYARNDRGVPDDYYAGRQQQVMGQPPQGYYGGGQRVPDQYATDNPVAPQGFNPQMYQGIQQGPPMQFQPQGSGGFEMMNEQGQWGPPPAALPTPKASTPFRPMTMPGAPETGIRSTPEPKGIGEGTPTFDTMRGGTGGRGENINTTVGGIKPPKPQTGHTVQTPGFGSTIGKIPETQNFQNNLIDSTSPFKLPKAPKPPKPTWD